MKELEQETELAQGLVVAEFWADWCGPCKIMKPAVEEVAQEEGSKATFLAVNADNFINIAKKFGIRSIPSLVIFKEGQLINRLTGLSTKEQIKEFLLANIP